MKLKSKGAKLNIVSISILVKAFLISMPMLNESIK